VEGRHIEYRRCPASGLGISEAYPTFPCFRAGGYACGDNDDMRVVPTFNLNVEVYLSEIPEQE